MSLKNRDIEDILDGVQDGDFDSLSGAEIKQMIRGRKQGRMLGGKFGKMRGASPLHGISKAQQQGYSKPVLGEDFEAANFKIVVSRVTATIAGTSLPFVLFGSQHFLSGYNNVVDNVAGGTLLLNAGIIGAAGASFDFEWTVGANSDIVRVVCNSGAPYPAFVMAGLSSIFQIGKIRMSLSDSTQLDQFSESFSYFQKTMFGKTVNDEIDVSSFKDPFQEQDGIIDIPFSGPVDSESGFKSSIIDVAGFSVTYSVYVERYNK